MRNILLIALLRGSHRLGVVVAAAGTLLGQRLALLLRLNHALNDTAAAGEQDHDVVGKRCEHMVMPRSTDRDKGPIATTMRARAFTLTSQTLTSTPHLLDLFPRAPSQYAHLKPGI